MYGKKKSILFLIPSLSNGGAEKVTVNLAEALSKDYSVTVCSFKKASDEYPVGDGINIVSIPKLNKYSLYGFVCILHNKTRHTIERWFPYLLRHPYGNLQDLIFVKKLKDRLKPDVTISMLNEPNAVNAIIKGGKRIMSERNDPRRKDRTDNAINLKSYKNADIVVFQTNEIKSIFPEYIQKKGIVISNPVSVDAVKYNADSKIIISAGRLHVQKNQSVLIKAFKLFHALYPDYRLYIYGEGPERKKLEQLIKELGLENHVFLPGFILDIYEKMKEAKMFVLSSDFEGLPNALMEAMMMGIPVISTACNGPRELIEDGVDGLLVPVGDEAAMSKTMEQLASDEKLCLKIRENALLSSESFRTEKIVEKWKSILE